MMFKVVGFWPRTYNYTCVHYRLNGELSSLVTFSTQSLTPSPVDELLRRISPNGHPRVSIVPILDQWANEGQPVDAANLKIVLRLLRKFRRYTHALQLFDWMSDGNDIHPSSEDVAVRLDLISRVHGIQEAECYLENIPDTAKTYKVYGSLLNCYAHKKLVDKAEKVMQSLKESSYNSPLSYNVMLGLYAKVGKYKQFEALLEEMEEKNISGGRTTLCTQLNVHAAKANIEGMDKLIVKIKNDQLISKNWHIFAVAANGYLKAGHKEKSREMIRELKKRIRGRNSKVAYRMLINMYARLGDVEEIYRVWEMVKKEKDLCNTDYSYMLSSLVKLGDFDRAEMIWEEWESYSTIYDFQIPNVLINGYIRKDMLEKAEEVVRKVVSSGKSPPASTWDLMASGYCGLDEMEKAVMAMREAILSDQGSWKLNRATVRACLKYMEERRERMKQQKDLFGY